MKNRITTPSVYILLFILPALLFGNALRAQITYDNFLPKSAIVPGALLTVSDPDSTQTGPGVFVNRTQYLSLVYTTEAHTDVQNYTAWSYGVVVKIMNGTDTTQYFTDTLNIRRNDSLPQYRALNHYTLPWHSLHIRVLTVCGKTGADSTCIGNPHLYPLLPQDIELQAGIIRTQINSFSAMLNIPSGPVEYDEGDVLESCEQQYNVRLAQLQQQYEALAHHRLEESLASLGIDMADMEDLEQTIMAQTLVRINRMVDTLVAADSLYYYRCDSLPIDTAHLLLLRNVSRNSFFDHFFTPYFTGFHDHCKEMYLGNQTYAQAHVTDSTGFIGYAYDGFDHWGANNLAQVWSLYPPGTGNCVMAHYGDTANHWAPRSMALISDMYDVRRSVLDDENTPDSLYMLYHGAMSAITIQTHTEYAAAVNALNDEMWAYCGYSGNPMADCDAYYEGLINANKAYMAHVIDSVADTIAVQYGIPVGMLGQPNPAVTSAINGLLIKFNSDLRTLDLQWAACAADSLQADSMMAVLKAVGDEGNHLPGQFLASREGTIGNQYQSSATLPTLGQWQTLTGNLINAYQTEGKDMALAKQAAIQNRWPALQECIHGLYAAHENGTKTVITNLLSKIDSTLDTLHVYGSSNSYSYEIALSRWMVDYENAPAYLDAMSKMDSLITEKNENCGSETTPSPESYLACLARTEADLQNLYYGRNLLLASLDGLTENFRGIARPGGWNDANADIMQLLDPLLGEYSYKSDSLILATIAPCISDSAKRAQFVALAVYNNSWEQTNFQQTFIPAYHSLFPDEEHDIAGYVTDNYDSLLPRLDNVYTGYLGQRLDSRFFAHLPALNLDPADLACIDSVIPVAETHFWNLLQAFFADRDQYLGAGAGGITPNDSGYRESVVYYSLLRASINKAYQGFFAVMDQNRLNCSSILKNTTPTEPVSPEPPTPSVEAEIAACQTDVENRFNQLGPLLQTAKENVVQTAFAAEAGGGMNIVPLKIEWGESANLLMNQTLNPVDSLWLGCNTDARALDILAAIFDSDVAIATLFENAPAYVTNTALLYAGGNTATPDYSHVPEFAGMDSLYYMAMAKQRAGWAVNKIQEQPGTYGVADSCIVYHETDSATEAQYAATYAAFKNGWQTYLDTFKPLYDSSTIDSDTLELKLRWVYAAQMRETYLFLQQYVVLMQEYEDCENLRTQLIVWTAERDPSANQPKKGIANRFPQKPVDNFPFLPITPTVMDLTTSTVTVVTETGPCGNVKYLEWAPMAQALEYDLEWAYIDNMVFIGNTQANQTADIAYRAFSLTEPTRVTVKENRFPFPGEYPDGKLYFRVRGIARIIDVANQSYDQPQFFPWVYDWSGYAVSSAPVNFNGSNPFNDDYENNLNWQWEASFAEEGKFKRVISYHDGLNRPNQVVTHLSTDKLSVIGETLYDHEGRAAVQVLPYPEPCYELSYRDQTRSDSLGGPFDKQDFELADGNERMATTYGASQYYSANNPFMAVENPLMHTGGIPDAGKYPYTQTAFMLDNTGRPVRSGGVGTEHTLAGEHATRYYYANASETELRRLFGKNVGEAAHYKKNAVMDANGQLSIAYVDQEGRSVATALAGLSPDNLLPLDSNQPFAFTQNLTANNIHNPVEGEWNISYGQLNEIPDNEYTFTYQYGLDRLFDGVTPPCIVCEFDLEIYVTDPDGNRLTLMDVTDGTTTLANTDYFYKRLDAAAYDIAADPCSTLFQTRQVTFTVTMPEVATYTIHKNLRWDKEAALADIWASVQPGVNSYTASVQTSILNTHLSQIDYTQCEDMFPGTGFGNIPTDVLDGTDELTTTSQCESYLTQMIDQITKYTGTLPSPTDEHPDENTTIVNSGIYQGDETFWDDVITLVAEGIGNPNDPAYIAPSSWDYLISGTTNAGDIVHTIRHSTDEWTQELKRELAKAHPEYCWYQKCLVYAQSIPFDAEMAQQSNLTNGEPYRNPLGQSVSVNPFGNSATLIPDPLKNNPDEKPVIAGKTTTAGPDNDMTIWNIADQIQDNYAANANITADQAAWQAYRGGYLQAKNDAFYTPTQECPYSDNPAAVIVEPEVPEDEEGMDNANQAAQNDWNNAQPCVDICRQNAIAWAESLLGTCTEPTDSLTMAFYTSGKTQIIQFLEQYCLSSDVCGISNPMGIITEQMFADAMAQGSPNLLWQAINYYNNNFANTYGCDQVLGTSDPNGGTTWEAPSFTYGEGEFETSCYTPPGFWWGPKYKIFEALNAIGDALGDRATPHSDIGEILFNASPGYVDMTYYLSDIPTSTAIPAACNNYNGDNLFECLNNNDVTWIDFTLYARSCRKEKIYFFDDQDNPINAFQVRDIVLGNTLSYNVDGDLITQALFKIAPLTAVNNFDGTASLAFTTPTTYVWGYVKVSLGPTPCGGQPQCTIFPNGWTVDITPGDIVEDCEEQLQELATQSAENEFNNWLENYVENLWQQTNCAIAETMKCTYTKSEYHYTLYYYDQAANLVQTVPPKGVHPLDVANTAHFSAQGAWLGANPPHDMESRYKFNSLEVAIESETPDGGLTLYTPDAMGRPMQSRNAEQRKRAAALGSGVDISSVTSYDNLGRITSVLELVASGSIFPFQQQTSTKYDTPVEIGQIGWKSENTRARVSSVEYYEENVLRHAVFYSYDIHGNVKSMVTQVPALKGFGQEFYRIDYYYDLVSGKVNEVQYQPKGSDRFFHRYTYDADNRLVMAQTSRDYINWERDAKYFYYPHGPLKRVETGERKVQGTDYFYTIHGWLKGVNSGALNETYDLGRDGDRALTGNPNGLVARDAFGFTLDYYLGDYRPLATTGLGHIPSMDPSGPGDALLERGLYNGNIAGMTTALRRPDEQRLPVLGYGYIYDQLNRIKQNYAYLAPDLHTTNSWNGVMGSNAYSGFYSYDANGNILSLQRHDGAGLLRDDFTYHYSAKAPHGYFGQNGPYYNYTGPQNRLNTIDDAVPTGTFADDMDDQNAGNYAYDEIGNLVKDAAEEIDKIEWTVYGKVKSVKRTPGSKKPDLYFYYTGSGQRYLKVVIPKNQTNGTLLGKHEWKATYYQHDAQGNIMATYDIKGGPGNCGYDMFLGEHVMYGSSRLGVNTYDKHYMGNTDKSLAYPSVQEIYVCYAEADDTNLPFEPLGDTPTGPIGGNQEILRPYGTHRVPQYTIPIFGVNLPWVPGTVTADPMPITPTREPTAYVPGRKRYEFSNHLGNVLVTISDVPIGMDPGNDGTVDYYLPDVKTTSDYEPFGAPLDGRTLSENNEKYAFGFNGQEKENDIYGEGNAYSFEYRIHDARIGRFFSTDPLEKKYPWYSPYQFAGNTPIFAIDLEGLEPCANPYALAREEYPIIMGITDGVTASITGTVSFFTHDAWTVETWEQTGLLLEECILSSSPYSGIYNPNTPILDAAAQQVNDELINGSTYSRTRFIAKTSTDVATGYLMDKGLSKIPVPKVSVDFQFKKPGLLFSGGVEIPFKVSLSLNFSYGKCVEWAASFQSAYKSRLTKLGYTVSEYEINIGKNGIIGSLTDRVADNGLHRFIEVSKNGESLIFDNFHPNGISPEDYVKSMGGFSREKGGISGQQLLLEYTTKVK